MANNVPDCSKKEGSSTFAHVWAWERARSRLRREMSRTGLVVFAILLQIIMINKEGSWIIIFNSLKTHRKVIIPADKK
jgi:hypothetical protein